MFITTLVGLTLSLSAWAVDPLPASQNDLAEMVKANNTFAIELYRQLRNQPGNLFFSPESISTALAMTYAGARSGTALEMANTMHFTLPPEKLHPAMGELLHELNATHDGYQLKVANALWGQQGYTFLPDFLTLVKNNYGAGFNTADFKGDTEASRQKINAWVELQTEGKIKDLLRTGALAKDTRLVLTNAIYFKGDWQTQFKKEETKDEDFHLSSKQTVKAPMMHRTSGLNYYGTIAFQVLEIPYNKELSMIVFLPTDTDGLATFEQSMTSDRVKEWLAHLSPYSEVVVTMPKFKIGKPFELGETLAALGMKKVFAPTADFSGMSSKDESRKDGNLYICAIVHKAFVDVNEEGTEAAAATAVAMSPNASAMSSVPLPPPVIFRADHPFLFLIRDNRSGSLLFMGRLSSPSE